MYCEECGHALDESGVCPICGWSQTSNQGNAQNQPGGQNMQPNMQNQYTGANVQPNIQPNMQPNMQPNIQSQYGGQNMQNQFGGPNVPPNMQPNMQNQYGRPNVPPNMQPNIQNQYGRPNVPPNMQQKKSKLPLIISLCSVALIAIIVTVIVVVKNGKTKDYTTEKEEPSTEIYTSAGTTEGGTEEPPVITASGNQTIMMYIVGSNLESNYAAASEDIQEILASGYDEEKINFLIYTGGCYDWDMDIIDDDSNSTFLVSNSDLVELATESRQNMGEASTLTAFLQYGYDYYPAEQYSLILWNHGGGSFFGFGYDELTGDSLTLDELEQAFSDSPFQGDNKLEWIGFDACLMATIETANALSPYANYLVASQEPEPGWGWDYSFLPEIEDLSSGADIGREIADSYIDGCEAYFMLSPFSYSNVTMSVMDLSQVESVESAINALFAQANANLSDATYIKYSRIRSTTKEIAAEYSGESSYDVVDLVDLAKHMEMEFISEATALESALSSFIVYSNSNESNANGVSIYYPYNAKDYSQYYIPMYYDFDFASDYADYISNFANLLTGENTLTAQWNPETMIPTANGDLTFSLQLTPEQAEACQNAYFVISRADVETPGNYIFVSMSNQTTMDDSNVLTAQFDGQIIYMQNDTTLEQYEVMYTEQEATSEYTRYLISSILFDESIEEDDAMYTYFVLEVTPDNPRGSIIGAYPIANLINTNGTEIFPERYEIDINDYERVAFGAFSHEFTSAEDLTDFDESDWSDVVLFYNDFPISDGFSTVQNGMIPGVPYFGMFVIEDVQGNRHCSNLVQLQ